MDAVVILAICGLGVACLVLWILWRGYRRLTDPKVPLWEKGLAVGLAVVGGVVSIVGDPVIGLPIIGGGFGALAITDSIGGHPGAPGGGDGGC